jgi:hypothetical protein
MATRRRCHLVGSIAAGWLEPLDQIKDAENGQHNAPHQQCEAKKSETENLQNTHDAPLEADIELAIKLPPD